MRVWSSSLFVGHGSSVVAGRPVVRLLNFTAYDPLKADLEASSMDVLRAILESSILPAVGGPGAGRPTT